MVNTYIHTYSCTCLTRRSSVWALDTGAEISALSLQQAESMGVSRNELTPSTAVMWAADSRRLDCLGMCALTLQLGDVTRTLQVSVLRALHSPLLSWHGCIGLGILPASFSRQMRQCDWLDRSGRRATGAAAGRTARGSRRQQPALAAALRQLNGGTEAPWGLSRASAADRSAPTRPDGRRRPTPRARRRRR